MLISVNTPLTVNYFRKKGLYQIFDIVLNMPLNSDNLILKEKNKLKSDLSTFMKLFLVNITEDLDFINKKTMETLRNANDEKKN